LQLLHVVQVSRKLLRKGRHSLKEIFNLDELSAFWELYYFHAISQFRILFNTSVVEVDE
jgi:hypothetical protein